MYVCPVFLQTHKPFAPTFALYTQINFHGHFRCSPLVSTLPFQCPRLFMFIIVSAIAIFGYLCFNLIATCCTSSTYALINLVCCLSCAHAFYLVFNIFASVWVFSGPATDNPYLGNECDARVVRGVQYYLVGWWVYLTLFALALCLTVSLAMGKASAAAVQSDLAREHEQRAALVAESRA